MLKTLTEPYRASKQSVPGGVLVAQLPSNLCKMHLFLIETYCPRPADNPGSTAASYVPPVASSTMQLPARSLLFLLVAMAAARSARGYSAASPVSSQQQQRHRMSVGHWLKSVLPPPAGDADSRNTADLDTADMIDPVLLASGFAKRQEDDYGHMRFGRSDDYGHMRFGRK